MQFSFFTLLERDCYLHAASEWVYTSEMLYIINDLEMVEGQHLQMIPSLKVGP